MNWELSPGCAPRSARFTIQDLTPLYAIDLVVSLALIEPALGKLEKLGDSLDAKQYLFIMPTGELAYLFPALREIPVRMLGLAGVLMLAVGLVPAAARLRKRGLDAWSALGLSLIASGLAMLAAEYRAEGEWVLPGRIGARYLAFAMISVGSFLCYRDRRYLATLGIGGFTWDLSSAVFWAALKKDPRATVPVPWRHHFDAEEGSGAPCWLVALVDICAIALFTRLPRSDFDPLRLFTVEADPA